MDDCRLIPLTKGKFAIVDAADYDFLAQWMAEIYIEKQHIYLGLFETPELAHQSYLEAAKEGHGEFTYVMAAQ